MSLQQIVSYVPGAKPVQASASFQGLAVTALAPVIVPLVAWVLGIPENEATNIFTHVVTIAGALYGLYGILRRVDIRLPWQKP